MKYSRCYMAVMKRWLKLSLNIVNGADAPSQADEMDHLYHAGQIALLKRSTIKEA